MSSKCILLVTYGSQTRSSGMFRYKRTIFRERNMPGFKLTANALKIWHIALPEDGKILLKRVETTCLKTICN
jgi:hypothetical protein